MRPGATVLVEYVHSRCLCVLCPFLCKGTTACGDSVQAGRFTCAGFFPSPKGRVTARRPLALPSPPWSQRVWIPSPVLSPPRWDTTV